RPKIPPATAGMLKMRPTQLFTAGLVAGTPSSSTSAGRMMRGSINRTYESNANPTAAVAQMAHCSGVSRTGLEVPAIIWTFYLLDIIIIQNRDHSTDVRAHTVQRR